MDGRITKEDAKKIGEIRKAGLGPVSSDIEKLAIEKEKHLLKVAEIEKELQNKSRTPPSKVEVINQKEIQKVEGKTLSKIENWPDIFKVAGEVVAKVAFPAIQKVTGEVTAKVANFPVIQKVVGVVDAKVTNLPEVQKVQVTNPTEKMIVTGEAKVTNLPLGKGKDKAGDPENFIGVRLTDGEHYYDISNFVTGGGAASGVGKTFVNSRGEKAYALLTDDNYLNVNVASGSTSGTEYTEGDTDASITGTALLWEDASNTLRAVSSAKPLPVSGDFYQETQPISGSVEVSNESIAVTGDFYQETQPISGSVTVSSTDLDIRSLANASDSVAIYGSDDGGTTKRIIKTDSGGAIQVDLEVASVTIDNESIAVTGDFYQETQPVSGTVTVSGQVTANLGTINGVATETTQATLLTESDFDTRIGEVQASPTANTVLARLKNINDSQLADDHNVTVSNASIAVTGTFFQETQPISGSVTVSATDLDVRDLSSASDSVLAVISDGADTAAVIVATSDSDPDLDGQNLLATHALLSARKDADTTIGLTAEDSTHNALHVAISDGEGIANVNASNQLEVAVGNSVTVDLGENNDVTMSQLPDTAAGDLAAINGAITGSLDVSGATVTVSATDLDVRDIDKGTDDILVYANTAKDGSGTDYVPLVDSDGHLQVDVLTAPSTAVTGTFWQETQPVSLASVPSHAVTNAGTFAVQISDPSFAVADGNALGEGVLVQGDDGTDRKNINVDATTGDVQVDVTEIIPGTGATNLGKAEDSAHSSTDTGVYALAVRDDVPAAHSGADGDYESLHTNRDGMLWVIRSPQESDLATQATTHTNKYYTASTPTDGIIWSPAAGKRWYVTDIFINVSEDSTVTLEDDQAGGDSAVWKAELAGNSGWSHSFETPLFSGEDAADLTITASAGTVYVTVTGYEI